MIKLFLSIIQIFIFIFILKYIYGLEIENCGCSKDYKRDIIKYINVFSLSFIVLLLLSGINSLNKNTMLFFNILGIINIIITIWYYIHLNNTNCKCAEKWERHILLGPILLQFFMVVYILLGINGIIKLPNKLKNKLK